MDPQLYYEPLPLFPVIFSPLYTHIHSNMDTVLIHLTKGAPKIVPNDWCTAHCYFNTLLLYEILIASVISPLYTSTIFNNKFK